jgi:ABC-2 type transport system permease protein
LRVPRTVAVAKRVLLEVVNDKRMLGLVVLAPIFAMFVFGTAFSGQVTNASTGIVNLDEGTFIQSGMVSVSNLTIASLAKNSLFDIRVFDNLSQSMDAAKRGEVYGVIYFPQNFSQQILASSQNATQPNNASVILYLDRSAPAVTEPMWDGVAEALDLNLKGLGFSLPASVIMQPVYGEYDVVAALKNYYVTGILVFIIFILSTLLSLLSFVGERTSGTLDRILSTPLRNSEVVVGYALAFGVIGSIQAVLLLITGIVLFNVSIVGNVGLVLFVAVLLAITCESLGVLLSSFARREAQAVQFIPFIVLGAFLLTGVFWPIQAFPSWLQPFSNIVPLTFAADAAKAVMIRGWGIDQISTDLFALIVFVFLFMVGAIVSLKKRR